MLQALLLDHDGTLVDSETRHGELWQETLKPYGIELSAACYMQSHAGYSTLKNAQDWVATYPALNPISADTLAQQKQDRTAKWLSHSAFALMPGAEALMAWANDKGLIQAIVTGGQRISVERTLHYHGLATYIDLITSQEDVTHNKPAPDSYRLTLERLGLNPQAAIAIEDNARGLQAACEAGIACIVVHNSFSKGQDFTGAIACVDNLTQALAWIKQTYYR